MGEKVNALVNTEKNIGLSVQDWSDIGFKKPVLVVKKGNVDHKVASFNNEESAELFLSTLIDIFSK